MKRMYFFRIAIFSFFLAGLTFVSPGDQLQAQTNSTIDHTYSTPQDIFVAPVDALVRLDGAQTLIKNALQQHAQGSSQYNLLFARYTCYDMVANSLHEGKGVAISIVDGLRSVASDEFNLPKGTVQSFRVALIDLLKL